ncbi:MAG TPA: hypothetical protein VMV29_03405 [Ktedonobacterales bacterium]|nr:hypothetical protein [Ktedonobacterales bacterium]
MNRAEFTIYRDTLQTAIATLQAYAKHHGGASIRLECEIEELQTMIADVEDDLLAEERDDAEWEAAGQAPDPDEDDWMAAMEAEAKRPPLRVLTGGKA